MKNIVIAGYGYVAAVLADILRAQGHRPIGIARSTPASDKGHPLIQADLGAEDLFAELPPTIDAAVFLASPDAGTEEAYAELYGRTLVTFLDRLAERTQGLRSAILVTSTAVYGQSEGEWVDEASPTEPSSFRGEWLLRGESELQAFADRTGTNATTVRLGGIYGPGRTRFLESVISGQTKRPASPHYTNRIHRNDAAKLLAEIVDDAHPPRCLIGVDDDPADLRDIIDWIRTKAGVAAPPEKDEPPTKPRRGGSKRCSNRLLHQCGYELDYPSYRDGYAPLLHARHGSHQGTL